MCALSTSTVHEDIVRPLIAAGARANDSATVNGDQGTTALLLAAQSGKDAIVKDLLAAGADVHRARTVRVCV